MLREGGLTDAHRSHRFVFVQVPIGTGNLHTSPALRGQARGQARGRLSHLSALAEHIALVL